MSKQNDSQAQAILDSLDRMHGDGMSRDAMIIQLVGDGLASLNSATKLYASWAKSRGLVASVASHKDDALAWLAAEFPVDAWDHRAVSSAIVELQGMYDVAESTARDYAKAYSEELGVAHPVLNPREAMFQWLIDNDGMDYDAMKAGFKAYAKDELGRSPSNINEYWKGYDLHLALVAAKAAQ